MKKIVFLSFLYISLIGFSQQDSLLLGKWKLFKVIDNMSGNEVEVPTNSNPDFYFFLDFETDSTVRFNLEINKCTNNYKLNPIEHTIKFLYYAQCTKICCDKDFSSLLTYEDCTKYYIKNNSTLVLVSEDRMFYFSRV